MLATLAEHLAGVAASLTGADREDSQLALAAGILEAAVRISPRDDRLARELVSARLGLGDIPASLEALEHYRSLRPDDMLAQIRYVDLSAAQMEVTEERLSYLIMVAQSERVPDEVRSHAATTASLVLRELMDDQAADAWLEQAVALDPYSPHALRMFYERRVETGASRAQRVDALTLLARSNIVQPAVLELLAEELAASGLTEQANDVYLRALQAQAALGIAPSLEFVVDVAALQLVADRPDAASQSVAGAIALAARSDPEAYSVTGLADLYMLDLLCRKRVAPAGQDIEQAIDSTANTLRFLLSHLSSGLHNLPPPTTQPDGRMPDTPLVDVIGDAAMLTGEGVDESRRQLGVSYARLMANLAWLDLYFHRRPVDERLAEALGALVPPESLALRRLRGWQLWRQGQTEAARESLLPISEEDRLARLALLLMEHQAGAQIEAAATELLSSEPTGLVGAFLSDALSEHGATVRPGADADAVRDALATLPADLFGLLEPQSVRNFYSLTADPRLARHSYGEPLLITVSIRNSGRHPITIGPSGLIQPILRLDALVRGQLQESQRFPAATALELWGAVRLDPGEKIEHVVRLDGPELSTHLASLLQPTLTVAAEVTTNPALAQTEEGVRHVTGPAGQSRIAQRMITRSGFTIDVNDPQLDGVINTRLEVLRTGQPLERLRMAQWTMGMIRSIAGAASAPGLAEGDAVRLRELAGRMTDTLVRAAGNQKVTGPDAAANAFVKYAAAVVSPESRGRLLPEMLASPAFEIRVLGLLSISELVTDAPAAEALVKPLAESDEDATVRRLAQDVLARLSETSRQPPLPQTQPATEPTPVSGK